MTDCETGFDDRRRIPAGDNHHGEELINRLCVNCGLSPEVAYDVLAEIDEARDIFKVGGSTEKNSVTLEMFFRYFIEDCENLWLELRAFAYLLKLDDVIGHTCPADWARQADCTRANATKAVKKIQTAFNLPPRQGQKNELARRKMSDRRKLQLKSK